MNLTGPLSRGAVRPTPVHHVSTKGLNVWPYDTRETAARSIAAALKAADDGDTVLIDDGSYVLTDELAVRKSITLKSRSGPLSTTIDADSKSRVVRVAWVGGRCVLEGIGFTGGSKNFGGGLLFEHSNNVVVSNCVVRGNTASYGGGGIGVSEVRELEIMDSRILENVSTGQGGGMALNSFISGGSFRIRDCEISRNHSEVRAGGVFMVKNRGHQQMQLMAEDCVFEGNITVNGDAGAIESESPVNAFQVKNSSFSGNTAKGKVEHVRGVALENCTLSP